MEHREHRQKKFAEQFRDYARHAHATKDIDFTALGQITMENEYLRRVSHPFRKWAYLFAVALPPIGLLFVAKLYFFSDAPDARQVARTCLVLSAFSIVLTWVALTFVASAVHVDPSISLKARLRQVQEIFQ